MKEFCIVIPIYNEEPDLIEQISLKRLWDVVCNKNYDIYYVTYKELNTTKYYTDETINKQNISEIYFDKSFFENKNTYSKLCINYNFYNAFSDYEYMYIYQTDCYLLDDKLSDFCKLNVDYIGSPIFSTDCGWPTNKLNPITNEMEYTPVVGNGGFSLRKIKTFMGCIFFTFQVNIFLLTSFRGARVGFL